MAKKVTKCPKSKQEVVMVVHDGRRFMFTKTEYNKAWLRAKKCSGLN